jgi:hypothetical protein
MDWLVAWIATDWGMITIPAFPSLTDCMVHAWPRLGLICAPDGLRGSTHWLVLNVNGCSTYIEYRLSHTYIHRVYWFWAYGHHPLLLRTTQTTSNRSWTDLQLEVDAAASSCHQELHRRCHLEDCEWERIVDEWWLRIYERPRWSSCIFLFATATTCVIYCN